ncbi:hypothetical protein [Segatella paludivivens]|uniref:hypothetical protein n=1 Tax=Segatella paludivivens TaxID=185294 RepID=UPI00036D85CA|nr:hypothetical protein [Segatella paludivivens]
MKKIIISVLAAFITVSANAQGSSVFKGYIYNGEYQVYINMDFYKKNIIVPNQEIYGELPGYFGANRDTRKWLFTSAEIADSVTAKLEITNDYGSEDLEGTLKRLSNGTYELEQKEGSTIKIVVNRKWVKIPKKIIFTKR